MGVGPRGRTPPGIKQEVGVYGIDMALVTEFFGGACGQTRIQLPLSQLGRLRKDTSGETLPNLALIVPYVSGA